MRLDSSAEDPGTITPYATTKRLSAVGAMIDNPV